MVCASCPSGPQHGAEPSSLPVLASRLDPPPIAVHASVALTVSALFTAALVPVALITVALITVALGSLTGCSEAPDAPSVEFSAGERAVLLSLSPVPPPPASPSNRWADDPAAAALGHALFFEQRFSPTGEVACATCHKPEAWFTDDRQTAKGLAVTPRHTPTVLGAAHLQWLFWDGRADSLWAQALGPLENPKEHGTNRLAVLHVIATHHHKAWEAAFGPLPDLSDSSRFPPNARPVADDGAHPEAIAWAAMTATDRALVDGLFANVGKAIAAYERLLTPGEAPFDRFIAAVRAGDAAGAGHLSLAAQRGAQLFVSSDNRCVSCHAGPRFTTDVFFNIGVGQPAWSSALDRGRYDGGSIVLQDPFNCLGSHSDADAQAGQCKHLGFLDPNASGTVAAFKVPSLRNVADTAPYMHAGQYASLDEVIDHYNDVGSHHSAAGIKEPFLKDLDLTARDNADLVAFLRSLSAPAPSGTWAHAPAVAP